jgi:hypothetical protein
VTSFSKYELFWGKVLGFVSDGTAAMTGKSNGIAAELKKKLKEFEKTTSFCSPHFIHQEASSAKSLKMTHVINNVVKTKNFICASDLNYREVVPVRGEIVSRHCEIFYHIM